MEKKVLGKGLEALIPRKAVSAPSAEMPKEFVYLALDKIKTGAYQPRRHMDEKELRELGQSIKEKGFIQPIVVRKSGDFFEVVAGGRRFEAARANGFERIPVMIKDIDDRDTLTLAIVENLQRSDLNPLDEALAFKRLMEEFEFTLDALARLVSKDKSTVANTLRLLKLAPDIQEALRKGLLSRSQARSILAAESAIEQRKLFEEILRGGMSVRDIEAKTQGTTKRKKTVDPFVAEAENEIQKKLGTKVRIINGKHNRGKIVIEYHSLDDFDRIVNRLKK